MAKVLLVEDDVNLCDLLALALRREGLTVQCTDNAYDAVQMLSVTDFDVAVIDLMLRASSGLYVIDALRRTPAARRPRVIVVTGTDALKTLDRSVVKAVLFKPLDMATFPPLVRLEADRAAMMRPRS